MSRRNLTQLSWIDLNFYINPFVTRATLPPYCDRQSEIIIIKNHLSVDLNTIAVFWTAMHYWYMWPFDPKGHGKRLGLGTLRTEGSSSERVKLINRVTEFSATLFAKWVVHSSDVN